MAEYSFKSIETFNKDINNFTVIDIETTGFGENARIVELAAVKFCNGKVVDTFDTLVNPLIPIPYFATKVHGIKDSDVTDSPTLHMVMPSFCEFIGDSVLVGHNVSFDLNFLLMRGCQLELKNRDIFDTLRIAKKYITTSNHKLETMIEYFNIEVNKRHRAKDDSIATGKLFLKLIDIARLKQKNEF